MNQQNVRFRIIKKSAFMSAMRQTASQLNCKSSVKSASSHQSVQRQAIRQINVKSTSENHPGPKNRKNGERLTPIASDRPGSAGAAPLARGATGGTVARNRRHQHQPKATAESAPKAPSQNDTTASGTGKRG